MMNNFYKLLQKIKDDPVLYLDRPSITRLHFFINGYLSTRYDMGLDREGTILRGFQDWIQTRAKTNLSISWDMIILGTCVSERSAFSRFFELFEQFLLEKDNLQVNPDENQANSHPISQPSNWRSLTLCEILEGVKRRPGMFLGTSSITRLEMYLRGYDLARREMDIPLDEQEREFAGFQSWIQNQYEIKSGQSWGKIILFYSVDEPEALTKFFELFEQYLNRDKNDSDKLSALVE